MWITCYKCVNIQKFAVEKCGYLMENSKKIYVIKSTVIKVISRIIWIMWISLIAFLLYPQYMCKSSQRLIVEKIDISEKNINKDLQYLKENIKLPLFIRGENRNSIEDINNNIEVKIMKRVFETENDLKNQFAYINEMPTFPYEIKSFYIVTEHNDTIISLYNDYYEYLGGAHGSTNRTGYTIDRIKEKIINLKDLFSEGFDYKEIINKDIREEIRKDPDKYFYSPENFKGILDDQGFYISDNNLVIFFNEYEIAPYVAGIPEFKIPVEEFGNNFIYSIS